MHLAMAGGFSSMSDMWAACQNMMAGQRYVFKPITSMQIGFWRHDTALGNCFALSTASVSLLPPCPMTSHVSVRNADSHVVPAKDICNDAAYPVLCGLHRIGYGFAQALPQHARVSMALCSSAGSSGTIRRSGKL